MTKLKNKIIKEINKFTGGSETHTEHFADTLVALFNEYSSTLLKEIEELKKDRAENYVPNNAYELAKNMIISKGEKIEKLQTALSLLKSSQEEKECSHAIGFAEWLHKNYPNPNKPKNLDMSKVKPTKRLWDRAFLHSEYGDSKTTQQLYELYLQSLPKQPESTNEK